MSNNKQKRELGTLYSIMQMFRLLVNVENYSEQGSLLLLKLNVYRNPKINGYEYFRKFKGYRLRSCKKSVFAEYQNR